MRNRWTRTRIDYHPCIASEPTNQVCPTNQLVPSPWNDMCQQKCTPGHATSFVRIND